MRTAGPTGVIFDWFPDAIEWAHRRASRTGVRVTVKRDRDRWRVAPK